MRVLLSEPAKITLKIGFSDCPIFEGEEMFLFLFDHFVYNYLIYVIFPSFSSPQLPVFLPSQIHDYLFYSYYCNVYTQVPPAELFCVAHLHMCSADCMGLENLLGGSSLEKIESFSVSVAIDCLSLFISGCGPGRFTPPTFSIISAVTYGDSRMGSRPHKHQRHVYLSRMHQGNERLEDYFSSTFYLMYILSDVGLRSQKCSFVHRIDICSSKKCLFSSSFISQKNKKNLPKLN